METPKPTKVASLVPTSYALETTPITEIYGSQHQTESLGENKLENFFGTEQNIQELEVDKLRAELQNTQTKLLDLTRQKGKLLESEVDDIEIYEKELKMLEFNINRTIKLVENKKNHIELLISMETSNFMTNTTISNAKLPGFRSEATQKKSVKKVVPNKLPKFRQGHIDDPMEFLEVFLMTMRAHAIPEEEYQSLLILCLDSIDRQWLLDFEDSKSLNQQITWSELSEGFITHFRHPNARIVWLDKIKTLKMDSHGVQRYTDQFIRLAKHLGWNLRSDEAVYQYKQGLPSWLLDSLISAEMALIGKDSNIPGVETLGKMALGIEANSRKKDYTSNHQFNKIGASNLSQKKKNYYSIQCGFCGRFGHEEIECKTKQRKEQFSSTLQPTTKSIIQETTTTNNTNSKSYAQKIICNICGKEGHYATECSERKKKIRIVEINNNGELTINEESSDNSILIPCTINGKRIFGLLDTGANLSIININLALPVLIETIESLILQTLFAGKRIFSSIICLHSSAIPS